MVQYNVSYQGGFVMSEGFKGFGYVFAFLGVILIVFSSSWWGNDLMLISGIVGIVVGIIFFVNSAFIKILEDSRDTLKRIEKLLENEETE